MTTDRVLTEVAPLTWRMLPLAEVLLSGGKRAGWKTWPTGLREKVYKLPRAVRTQKDDGAKGLDGKVFLTQAERKSLERYIGEPVWDAQDAKRKMKAKNLRFSEKGEEAQERIDATIDYAEADGEKKGEKMDSRLDFVGWDKLLPSKYKSPEQFDFEARVKFHEQRLLEEQRRNEW